MTIAEAIARIDELKPNTASQSDKVRWLGILDGTVQQELINTHIIKKTEADAQKVNRQYSDDTPVTQELLIPYPYEDVYIYWLESQIDYTNGETKRYSNAMAMYNSLLSAFRNQHNRTHDPIGTTPTFF